MKNHWAVVALSTAYFCKHVDNKSLLRELGRILSSNSSVRFDGDDEPAHDMMEVSWFPDSNKVTVASTWIDVGLVRRYKETL